MTKLIEKTVLSKLLKSIGENDDYTLRPISGGKNNRAFRLDVGNSRYLLKEYFRDVQDNRDRLKAEFAFCEFVQSCSIKSIALPIASEPNLGLGIYEFIEGVNCSNLHVSHKHTLEAANFINTINTHKTYSLAQKLPNASEACFTLFDHLHCVSRRVNRLARISANSTSNLEAIEFSKKRLATSICKINRVFSKSDLPRKVAKEEKSLSPSDFGFHNMLIDKNGRLRFIDFEYAGWDDPAKIICDFFCQPKFPVPMNWMDSFIEEALGKESWVEIVRNRVRLLYPLYRIKWCCIILNEFLPRGSKTDFSNSSDIDEDFKIRKLNAAEDYLNKYPMLIEG